MRERRIATGWEPQLRGPIANRTAVDPPKTDHQPAPATANALNARARGVSRKSRLQPRTNPKRQTPRGKRQRKHYVKHRRRKTNPCGKLLNISCLLTQPPDQIDPRRKHHLGIDEHDHAMLVTSVRDDTC